MFESLENSALGMDDKAGPKTSLTVHLTGKGLARPLEAVLALLGLVVVMPLLILSMVAIVLTSRGPVFFCQKRIGRNGLPFVLYKFRTMSSQNDGIQVTASDDARVTRVGKLLRKTKLDELPELWNVVRGDMSLVGPRPEVPRYVDLENSMWQFVLKARPGITDPVTLSLRNEEVLITNVKADRERFYMEVLLPFKLQGYSEYLRRRSSWGDVKVLWCTGIAVMFPGKAPITVMNELLSCMNETDYAGQ
ncbi:MAG TPA: sugar transferase [Pyrinomonadaceae bacterium]|jgi:lipopolysaccharide/colanic/teichoic acid biosynthesis glycosyltransferase